MKTQDLRCPVCPNSEMMYVAGTCQYDGGEFASDMIDIDYREEPYQIFACCKCETYVLGCPRCCKGDGRIFDDLYDVIDTTLPVPVTHEYFKDYTFTPLTFLGCDVPNGSSLSIIRENMKETDDPNYTSPVSEWTGEELRLKTPEGIPDTHKKEYIRCYLGDLGHKYVNSNVLLEIGLDEGLCITGPDGGFCHYWLCDGCNYFNGFTDK